MKNAKAIKIISISFFIILILVIAIIIYCRFTYSTLHISPTLCENSLGGISPDDFCQNRGRNTWLEGKYLFAKVDKDGCLIVTLKRKVISEWKNTFTDLQILQCVLDDRDIGITIDYEKDFMDYMKDAHTCGFEISSDFTRVVDSPDDNSWYFPFITMACARMQMFEGKSCSEVRVEYIELGSNGEVINLIVYPNDEIIASNIE